LASAKAVDNGRARPRRSADRPAGSHECARLASAPAAQPAERSIRPGAAANASIAHSLWEQVCRRDRRLWNPQAPQVHRVDGWDYDRVARTHRFQSDPFDLALLLVQPRGFDVGLDFLKLRYSARLGCL